VRRLLVTVNVVPSSPILFAVMMEALSFFDTSVLTRTTRRNIAEEVILHNVVKSHAHARAPAREKQTGTAADIMQKVMTGYCAQLDWANVRGATQFRVDTLGYPLTAQLD
jgi:hypothetical protein